MNTLNAVIAMLVDSHTAEEREKAHRELMLASIASAKLQPKAAKPAKVKLPKIAKDPKVIAAAKDDAIVVPWNGSGDNDHAAFLVNYRKAKTREESIAAINQYVGYNPGDNFGAQEYRAISAARVATAKKVENEIVVHRRIDASIMGYVAGMPNHSAKAHQNVLAREVFIVDQMLEDRKIVRDSSKSESERAEAAERLAKLESV